MAEKKSPRAEREEEILAFWKEKNIFQKSLEKPSPAGEFVFYEGPPTANGRPGIHHLESRAFKDAIPRYKTMRGFMVRRQAGWDTHGLPVELEVEKKLGLKSKKEIESYGIAKFNAECRKNVWTYIDEWQKFSERIGYWLDFSHPYITYTPDYIESVWNIVSGIDERKLLYKDYKVVPWCPRCGTALSSHELAQGYRDVKDLSVTAEFRVKDKPDTSLIAWTTTPWTLPGNVALAVNPDIIYVEIEKKDMGAGGSVKFILAKDRLNAIFGNDEYSVLKEMKGKELAGLEYEPLYPFLKDNVSGSEKLKLPKAFKVYPADFVTTKEGTGIVHTAVMYGQDDFELGTKVGLPKQHLVGADALFLPGTGWLTGRSVIDENLAVDILKDLQKRDLLFSKENHLHPYPFCWRCGTRLIYFARDSWYIAMSKLRDDLLAANSEIHWEPEHIREGRFGEWLREVKDWAVSRERYWGTPLPIWQSEDGSEKIVVDSIEMLKKLTKKSGNRYFVMRHGWAKNNALNILNSTPDSKYGLTEQGKLEVEASLEKFKGQKITKIFSSKLPRALETAEMMVKGLGLHVPIIQDERLNEVAFGDLDGKSTDDLHQTIPDPDRFIRAPDKGETLADVRKRMGEFLYEIEEKYHDEKILIVSHTDPLWAAYIVVSGCDANGAIAMGEKGFTKTGEIRELPFVPLPHNESYELDLHRPYIDDVVLEKNGREFLRVKEVMDVWFDSGAMPFAGQHYPFENKKWVDTVGFPADYISEAVDQTRGWFYTLHAIGVLTGRGKAFKNVICLGLLLDKEGQKMSKSKGNTVNPWEMMDKFGSDALRYWMYTINQPGESKNFDERTVDDVVKKVFNLFLNVVKFYELYAPKEMTVEKPASEHVLDRWILAHLDVLVRRVTQSLDDYKLLEAARDIRDFIADLSQWYVRRSRDRFKSDDVKDRDAAIQTLGFVLAQCAKLMAPFMPFLAEDVYQRVTGGAGKESVHLEDWPHETTASAREVLILEQMKETRKLVSAALEARARAGIKIRQPLGLLTVRGDELTLTDDHLELIMDEVNVKNISFDQILPEEVLLDTEITPELEKEGQLRDLVRAIQEERKLRNLSPGDPLDLTLALTARAKALYEENEKEIKKISGLRHVIFEELADDSPLWFVLRSA